jgi:7-alpha-hydroxysteroid dehydrogenase
MTHMLGSEFAPEVRVNSIVVGQIDTPGASSVITDELKQRAAANIPMRRMGQSSDIAACALYLASPASSWVTGRTIAVNGGADGPPLSFPIPSLREQVFGAGDR